MRPWLPPVQLHFSFKDQGSRVVGMHPATLNRRLEAIGAAGLKRIIFMFKPIKLKALAAVAGACAAMFASAPANAYVYAVSELRIRDFTLNIQPTAVTTVGSFSFDLTNTATLNGLTSSSSSSCGGTPGPGNNTCGPAPVLNATVVNALGSTLLRPENSFAFLNADNVNTYSNADSVITSAELVTGTPTSTSQIAESLLNINGRARANSEIQSNTSLTVSFSIVGGPATLDLSFKADPDQRAQISGSIGAYLAQSNMNASISLSNNTTGGSINWTPRGTNAFNDCVTGLTTAVCTETADDVTLNKNISTALNPSTSDSSYDVADFFQNFGIHVANLEAGDYTIALNSLTSTSISRAVPEPGSLGLIGLSLLGLGFGASRRQSKQG